MIVTAIPENLLLRIPQNTDTYIPGIFEAAEGSGDQSKLPLLTCANELFVEMQPIIHNVSVKLPICTKNYFTNCGKDCFAVELMNIHARESPI